MHSDAPAPRQISLARILALVVVWAVAVTWPRWLGSWRDGALSGSPWQVALVVAFLAVPVGGPLTLAALRPRRAWQGMTSGALLAGLFSWWYLFPELGRRTIPINEYCALAVLIAGWGAWAGGCAQQAMQAIDRRARMSIGAWGISAFAATALLCFFVYMVRVT